MPTIPLSINGVPYTDTVNFLREAQAVIERDVNNVFVLLDTMLDDTPDEFDDLPLRSRMGGRCCRMRCESHNNNSKFVSKRKEVK